MTTTQLEMREEKREMGSAVAFTTTEDTRRRKKTTTLRPITRGRRRTRILKGPAEKNDGGWMTWSTFGRVLACYR
jgi:hypothetical protein